MNCYTSPSLLWATILPWVMAILVPTPRDLSIWLVFISGILTVIKYTANEFHQNFPRSLVSRYKYSKFGLFMKRFKWGVRQPFLCEGDRYFTFWARIFNFPGPKLPCFQWLPLFQILISRMVNSKGKLRALIGACKDEAQGAFIVRSVIPYPK